MSQERLTVSFYPLTVLEPITPKSKTPIKRQDERRRQVEEEAKAAANTTPVTGRQRAPPRDRSGGDPESPLDDHEPAAVDPPILAVTLVIEPAAPATADASDRRGSPTPGRDGRPMIVETNDDDSRYEAGDRFESSQSRSHHGKKRWIQRGHSAQRLRASSLPK
jgi:hypothetical protein